MLSNKVRLQNFINSYGFDEGCDTADECNTGYNDLSFSYRKKIDIIHDVLRGRFHNKKKGMTPNGEVDSFVPTNYNQIYAYYRTYHQLGDIDTKNISLYANNNASNFRTKLLQGLLFEHLNNIHYAKFTDELSRKTAAYGNGIIKIVDGIPYLCNPLNVYYDNSARSIQDTSIVERFTLQYHEAIELYPEFQEEIDELYAKVSDDGYNDLHFINFNSWFNFGKKVRKGVSVFLDRTPTLYNSPTLMRYKLAILEDGGIYDDLLEVDLKECTDWTFDADGNKDQQLFPYVVSEAFPVDGEVRAQGIIEILLPLAARFNQLMERMDRLINSSLSGVKINEFDVGFESDFNEDDLRNMRPDEILTMVKDKQNLRAIVDNSVSQEVASILTLINFIKGMMNEITGVTNFAISAEMSGSAKATTASSIVSASQTPFKKFIERMGEAHKEVIGNFILPYIIKNSNSEVRLDNVSKALRQQIVHDAAINEVNKNWDKYNKALWNKTKEMGRVTGTVAARVGDENDYDTEVAKIVQKWETKPIKFVLGEWAKRLGSNVTVDVDNEYADKERKFNKLIQLAGIPMIQQVLKAEEIAMELLRNSDVDNYDFIKTKWEQLQDQMQQEQMEVYKNTVAQQLASEQGGYGELGGRPRDDELTNRVQAKVPGAQPVTTQI